MNEATQAIGWLQVVHDAGPTVVALVAAAIAGTIAYRQWKTARDKLKADLFDRRTAVYEVATRFATAAMSSDGPDPKDISDLSARIAAAEWLFDKEISKLLDELCQAGIQHRLASMTEQNLRERLEDLEGSERELVASQIEELRSSAPERQRLFMKFREQLSSRFSPFMHLTH